MTTTRPRRRPLACVLTTAAAAALAAGALITAATVLPSQRARAQDSGAQAGAPATEAADGAGSGGSWCSRIPPNYGHPPVALTPLALRVLEPSIEPVPATDGLIHLAYVAQVTNVLAQPLDIVGVVPADPLAGFAPTGRNHVVDEASLLDATGLVQLFDTPAAAAALPGDGPRAGSPPGYSTRVLAGNSGVMYFDVTYTDPARIPRLLAHAVTVAAPASGPALPALYAAASNTNPVPVGCRPLAVLRPPLAGHGWLNSNGCCTFVDPHRSAILKVNGTLQAPEQFAIDYIQIGPNNACCNGGSPQALSSWLGYDAPILAAAPGVVVAVVDGLPDQQPVGTVTGVTAANASGNSVIVDIGGGRYIGYGHLRPGSIPASVRAGTHLKTGDPIGHLGNSGNSSAPHLHFQVMDSPSFLDTTGLPFVFDTQLLEGTVTGGDFTSGFVIDRTGAGLQRNRMPAKPQVFGYNLSSSQ
jgi:hypothetical protein